MVEIIWLLACISTSARLLAVAAAGDAAAQAGVCGDQELSCRAAGVAGWRLVSDT